MTWDEQFTTLYQRCLEKYQSGDRDYKKYYTQEDLSFLNSIGYKPRELFDFVEDYGDEGVPSPSTALLIAAVRRDYFLVIQKEKESPNTLRFSDLPTFGDALEGILYLPRIIAKAKAKLRGELDPDIMFSCGGDRKFLREHGDIHPADFLRQVWAAGNEDHKMVEYVKKAQKPEFANKA